MPKTMDPKTTEDRTRRGAGPVMKRRRASTLGSTSRRSSPSSTGRKARTMQNAQKSEGVGGLDTRVRLVEALAPLAGSNPDIMRALTDLLNPPPAKPTGIDVAMCQVMVEVAPIQKMRENKSNDRSGGGSQVNFKFRGIDDVYNELHAIFAKHKIYTLPRILEHKTQERATRNGGTMLHHIVRVEYVFRHEDGSSISSILIGEAADSGDKGAGKAQQYAYKVALLQMFLIPTEGDNDPDAHIAEWGRNAPQGPPPQQQGGRGEAPPRRDFRNERPPQQPAQRRDDQRAAPRNDRGAPPPAGEPQNYKDLAADLRKQLCSTKSLDEMAQVRTRIQSGLQLLAKNDRDVYDWVRNQAAAHEDRLRVSMSQEPAAQAVG